MFFEYEMLKRELESLQQGLVAYENCKVVSDYYQKYGYTEHLRILIGDEGLISNIIEAGSKFIEWLKKKIINIIQAIKRFLLKILNKVLVFFGFKPIESENNRVQMHASWAKISKEFKGVEIANGHERVAIPYLVVDISKQFTPDRILDVAGKYIPEIGDTESIHTYSNEIHAVVDRMITVLQKQKDGTGASGPRYQFKKVLSAVFTTIDTYILNLNEWTDSLAKFEATVHEDMDPLDIVKLLEKATAVSYIVPDNIALHTLVSGVMQINTILISAHATVVQHAIPALLDIADCFSIGEHNVHIVEPIDNDFKRRMEGLFGHSFKLDNMIITNKDPRAWILNTDEDNPSGWCIVGENVTGVRTIYVNYNYILHYIKQAHGQLTTVAKHVLKTIVHESRHVFDGQTGRKFDDFSIKWEDRQHEQRAIHASNIFVITDHDIRWIEGILRRIKTDYTK